eukprot:g15600.t1
MEPSTRTITSTVIAASEIADVVGKADVVAGLIVEAGEYRCTGAIMRLASALFANDQNLLAALVRRLGWSDVEMSGNKQQWLLLRLVEYLCDVIPGCITSAAEFATRDWDWCFQQCFTAPEDDEVYPPSDDSFLILQAAVEDFFAAAGASCSSSRRSSSHLDPIRATGRMKVLEIGCGSGLVLAGLVRAALYKATELELHDLTAFGTDLNKSAVSQTRALIDKMVLPATQDGDAAQQTSMSPGLQVCLSPRAREFHRILLIKLQYWLRDGAQRHAQKKATLVSDQSLQREVPPNGAKKAVDRVSGIADFAPLRDYDVVRVGTYTAEEPLNEYKVVLKDSSASTELQDLSTTSSGGHLTTKGDRSPEPPQPLFESASRSSAVPVASALVPESPPTQEPGTPPSLPCFFCAGDTPSLETRRLVRDEENKGAGASRGRNQESARLVRHIARDSASLPISEEGDSSVLGSSHSLQQARRQKREDKGQPLAVRVHVQVQQTSFCDGLMDLAEAKRTTLAEAAGEDRGYVDLGVFNPPYVVADENHDLGINLPDAPIEMQPTRSWTGDYVEEIVASTDKEPAQQRPPEGVDLPGAASSTTTPQANYLVATAAAGGRSSRGCDAILGALPTIARVLKPNTGRFYICGVEENDTGFLIDKAAEYGLTGVPIRREVQRGCESLFVIRLTINGARDGGSFSTKGKANVRRTSEL